MEIYFDNAATTKLDPQALEAMMPFLKDDFGNSASIHKKGVRATEAVEKSRKILADKIKAEPEEIIFTSGGTESNNFAIKAAAFANQDKGKHIVTSQIEHSCVYNSCKWLEKQGFEITYLKPDNHGFINPEDVKKALRPDTILVSIIHGHNELGVIQDLEGLGRVCKNVIFHSDACQSFTRENIDSQKQNFDLLTLNAHKINGPKGVGALYIRKGTRIGPWQSGGGHEKGMRAGTLNVPGIVGFAKAVELADSKKDVDYVAQLKNRLKKGIEEINGIKINSSKCDLPHILSVTFPGLEGEALLESFSLDGLYISTGSACSSHNLQPSRTLLAIGLYPQEANSTIRFSLNRMNTKEEVGEAISIIENNVKRLRKISPF